MQISISVLKFVELIIKKVQKKMHVKKRRLYLVLLSK